MRGAEGEVRGGEVERDPGMGWRHAALVRHTRPLQRGDRGEDRAGRHRPDGHPDDGHHGVLRGGLHGPTRKVGDALVAIQLVLQLIKHFFMKFILKIFFYLY